jgi:riboflavin-specific deaminase-like protein
VRQLLPERRDISPAELAAGLRLDDLAPPERPYLVLNMVSSLDGKATLSGRTAGISSELDRELFHELRAQAGAVMVGAGTVREERYGRMIKTDELREKRRAAGLEPDALAVIVSGRLELTPDLPIFGEPDQRVLILTAAEHELEGVEAQVEYLRAGDDLPLLAAKLREDYGVRSVVCEGGPTLNSHLLGAGLVDELFLSLHPLLAGGGEALTIVAGRTLVAPPELELVSLSEADSDLFTRWRIRR